MSVSHDDVRHIADLARLTVSPSRLDALAVEISGILAHMDVVATVDTSRVAVPPTAPGCTHLRSDSSGPIPLVLPRESFAPSIREGFFTVPRLASHEVAGPSESGDATL